MGEHPFNMAQPRVRLEHVRHWLPSVARVAQTLHRLSTLEGTEDIAALRSQRMETNMDKNDSGRMIRQGVDGQLLQRCDGHSPTVSRGGYESGEGLVSAEDRETCNELYSVAAGKNNNDEKRANGQEKDKKEDRRKGDWARSADGVV